MVENKNLVWLASYPKSGNTWFRIFFANLFSKNIEPVDINDFSEGGYIASCRETFDAITMLDSGLIEDNDIDQLRPRMFQEFGEPGDSPILMKVHDAYTILSNGEPLLGNDAFAAIYLVRDPRDIALSLAHHLNVSVDHAIDCINNPAWCLGGSRFGAAQQLRQRLLGWRGHVLSWLDNPRIPVRIIRYEDLLENPTKCFTAAVSTIRQKPSAADIARSVHNSSFHELSRQEKSNGFKECTSRDFPFFREGRSGLWRAALNDQQLRKLETVNGDVMQRLGYCSTPSQGVHDAH